MQKYFYKFFDKFIKSKKFVAKFDFVYFYSKKFLFFLNIFLHWKHGHQNCRRWLLHCSVRMLSDTVHQVSLFSSQNGMKSVVSFFISFFCWILVPPLRFIMIFYGLLRLERLLDFEYNTWRIWFFVGSGVCLFFSLVFVFMRHGSMANEAAVDGMLKGLDCCDS